MEDIAKQLGKDDEKIFAIQAASEEVGRKLTYDQAKDFLGGLIIAGYDLVDID